MLSKNKKIIYDYTPLIPRAQIHPLELLANAIVLRAVDYYRLLRSGRVPTMTEEDQLNAKQSDIDKKLAAQKLEIQRFFGSKWYSTLSKVDGKWMFEKLRQERSKPWKPTHKYVEVNREKLQQIINEKELSYNRLYHLTGVKGEYFYRIFCGKTIIPLKRFRKIANGLKVEPDELAIRYINVGDE